MRPLSWLGFILPFILVVFGAIYSENLLVHYPDEHFQTLEIANILVRGIGWKAWEWYLGSRSYFGPLLYVPAVYVLSLFGITSGESLIYGLKFFTSMMVLLGLFHGLRKILAPRKSADLLLMGLLLLHPFFLYFSTTTFTDTLTLGFIGWILPLWWRNLDAFEGDTGARRSVFAGVLVGTLFLFRVQNLILIGAPLFWIFGRAFFPRFRSESFRTIFSRVKPYAFGATTAILFSGILDWITWGSPFKSTYQNIYLNLFKGVASSNGTDPFYGYLLFYGKTMGWTGTLLLLAALLYQFWKKPLHYCGPILFLLIHCIIPHKELRFLFPILPFAVLAVLQTFEEWKPQEKFRVIAVSAIGLVLFVGNPRWKATDYTTPFGASLILMKNGELIRSIPDVSRTLLLLDTYWVWTRGEMGIGAKVLTKELATSDVKPEDLPNYTFLLQASRGPFLDEILPKTHQIVDTDAEGRALWMKSEFRK